MGEAARGEERDGRRKGEGKRQDRGGPISLSLVERPWSATIELQLYSLSNNGHCLTVCPLAV